jgi:hypothetical protein
MFKKMSKSLFAFLFPPKRAAPVPVPLAAQYPIMHRIPEVEVWTESMDDRIRWHNFGPLGPYVAGDRPVFGTQ